MCLEHDKKDFKQIEISKTLGKCCQTQVINSNIKDNYIGSNNVPDDNSKVSSFICTQQLHFQNYLKSIPKNVTPPPLLSPGNIYLFNSVFLI